MYNAGMSDINSPTSKENNPSASEIKIILSKHKIWLETSGREGKQANLKNHQLKGAVMIGADLKDANLEGAYLY